MKREDGRPLVVHVVYRFATGGLENGVVNLINRLPRDAYRHMVIALTEVTDFKARIETDDVRFVALHKPPGHAFHLYPRLFRLFREHRPAIVHTRNLGALEAALPAWAAGVPVRVHSEHGRDVGDLDGTSRKGQWIRRLYSPCVTYYLALSQDLEQYLVHRVGIAADRVGQIYNGVDTERFFPAGQRSAIPGCPFGPQHWLVGTVGRMQEVKDQTNLARAFVLALRTRPALGDRLRLVMVGGGPLRAQAQAILDEAGMADLAWLPGERADIPDILRGLDLFVLPSLAEGVSNTILEAMASGLPVVATAVGGNRELVRPGTTGTLVPAADSAALAAALADYALDPAAARRAGLAGRAEIERRFSIGAMVDAYHGLYGKLLASRWAAAPGAGTVRP